VQTSAVPIALQPASDTPPLIAGGVGLPLLERFDLLIDYPHNRMYATPHNDAATASFFKDRLGMIVGRKQYHSAFAVVFVSPGSPAESAGFKVGEKISSIDDKTTQTLSIPAQVNLGFTEPGRTFIFTMEDGRKRRVTAADFF
jgi:C-terminal processing protease CtpA/Prc